MLKHVVSKGKKSAKRIKQGIPVYKKLLTDIKPVIGSLKDVGKYETQRILGEMTDAENAAILASYFSGGTV